MANYDYKLIKKELCKQIDEKRYEHTLGVADTAACLAMRYNIDIDKAYLAGLLHDCAKCFDSKKRMSLCDKYNIELTKFELDNPSLIHAKLGAVLVREKYGIIDNDIISAIRYHTTGREDMTSLEKIIFSADYIEPNRKLVNRLSDIRSIIFNDLDEAVFMILENTVSYLDTKKQSIDDTSLNALEYYRKIHIEKYIH